MNELQQQLADALKVDTSSQERFYDNLKRIQLFWRGEKFVENKDVIQIFRIKDI